MSRTAKWILGILIVVLFACAVVSVGVIFFSRFNASGWAMEFRIPDSGDAEEIQPWRDLPIRPDRIQPWRDLPLRPDRAFPGRILPRIFPFGGLFGMMLCLGFLLLLGLSAAALVISLTRSIKPVPAAAVAAPPAPLSAASESESPTKACLSCAHPVNDDWSHCPYCGAALTAPE